MRHLMAALALAMVMPAMAQTPKLVVVISVDQFSSNLFNQHRDDFSLGLKTLATQGAVYPGGFQSHAATETCPGHATLLTGRHPSGTGIVANQWYDKKTGKDVYCTVSEGYSVPGSDVASGPANLQATTLGDWLKQLNPQNRIFSVAGKDRSAIMMAGHTPDGVYWFDRSSMKFQTYLAPGDTDYAAKIAPLEKINSGLIAEWTARPPVWTLTSQKCTARAGTYASGDYKWNSQVPPAGYAPQPGQPFVNDKAFAASLRPSPAYDRLITNAALSLLASQKLGQGAGTDILAIGLSATDYIGHAFGNQGVEMCDQMTKLDGVIGDILAALKTQAVPFVLVLTADHGGLDAVERVQAEGEPLAYRTDPMTIFTGVNAAVRTALKLKADPFTAVGVKNNAPEIDQLHFTDALPSKKRGKAIILARDWLIKNAPVETVFSMDEIKNDVPPKNLPPDEWSIANRVAVNYRDGRSGDLYVVFKPYGASPANRGYVAGHGSPYDYDRRVPILFYGTGVPAQERALSIDTVDIAPTLANMLGVVPPVPVDGRCLALTTPCPREK